MSMVEGAGTATCNESWADVPRMFRDGDAALPPPWQDLFGPLRRGLVDGLMVVGQFGQSIDARIATASGDSRYISGAAGLAHLHRLRALVDAVLIGVGTANIDDPQLTVRRVSGPSPVRVIVDPSGRLPATARVLVADGIRRLVITRTGTPTKLPDGVEIAGLPEQNGLIAPIIIGAGPSSVTLPPIAGVEHALRAPIRAHVLGEELLVDCDLSGQRVPLPFPPPQAGER